MLTTNTGHLSVGRQLAVTELALCTTFSDRVYIDRRVADPLSGYQVPVLVFPLWLRSFGRSTKNVLVPRFFLPFSLLDVPYISRAKGKKPLDLAAVLKRKIQPAFTKVGITGVGWHTFRHTVGTMLAEMGEHQLTIRDYLRHSNVHVTNKYLQATPESKRLAQGKLVDAILPSGLLSVNKSTLIQ